MRNFIYIIKKKILGIDIYSSENLSSNFTIDVILPRIKREVNSKNIIILDKPSIDTIKNHKVLINFLYKSYNSSNSLDDIIKDINNYGWTWTPKNNTIQKFVFDEIYPQLVYEYEKLSPIKVERKRLFRKPESAILIDRCQIIGEDTKRCSEIYTSGWKYEGKEIKGHYRIVYSERFDLTPKEVIRKAILCNLPGKDTFLLLPNNPEGVLEVVDENELVGLNYKDYNYISDPSSIEKIINSTLI